LPPLGSPSMAMEDASNMDIEKNQPDGGGSRSGSCKWTYIIVAVVVVVVVAVVVAVVSSQGGSSDSSSISAKTNFYTSASVGLNGVTGAQFTPPAQAAFKTTVATKLGASPSAIYITSYTDTRRSSALIVAFKYYASSAIPASTISTLSTFLSAGNSTANGFTQLFQTQLTSAGVTFPFTGTSGITVTEQARLMNLPTMTIMPTSSGSRRSFDGVAPSVTNNAPQGSAVYKLRTDVETVVPGGVDTAIKMPKDILCYVGMARVDDPGVWSGRTAPPTSGDSSGTYLAKYDPALCDSSKQLNQTSEYMSYQAWHTGSPKSNLQIHAYLWVFNQDPSVGDVEPFVACHVTFTFDSSDLITNTELVFSIGGDSLATSPTMVDEHGSNTQSGCARITSELSTDANGYSRYTGITSLVAINGIHIPASAPYLTFTNTQNEAAVMSMSSTTAGTAQTDLSYGRDESCNQTMRTAMNHGSCSSSTGNTGQPNGAALLAFDATKGAILTANSTANLDASNGPSFCLDRSKSTEYVMSYSAYDADTGEKWIAPAGGSSSIGKWNYYNSSVTDANGKAWAEPSYPQSGYDSSTRQWRQLNPQPTSGIYCHETGEYCNPSDAVQQDIDGDGNDDGWFPANTLPDFSGASPANNEDWHSADSNVILRPQHMKVVPEQLPNPAASCSSLTLTSGATSTSDLTCGTKNANRASIYTPPSVPSVFTFIDGVRQI